MPSWALGAGNVSWAIGDDVRENIVEGAGEGVLRPGNANLRVFAPFTEGQPKSIMFDPVFIAKFTAFKDKCSYC